MARRAALGGFSLNLFGGGGVDAGVFNVAGQAAAQSKTNEAYLGLTRVEVQYEAGQVSNDEYLAALKVYADSFKPDTSEYLNQQARLLATTDRIERNVLVGRINAGQANLSDLLAYDQSKLSGMNPDSQEYLDRLSLVSTTQQRMLADEERDVQQAYSDGKMTATQLQVWYKERAQDPRFWGNFAISEDINAKIREMDGRIVDERDAQMVADFSDGKISPTAFLMYAGEARARYAEGTAEAKNWDRRIDAAGDAAVEDDLNYRYSLSQDYARLAEFVASNKPPTSHTSTSTSKGSTSTRTILGADGKWKTVKVTTGAGTKTSTVGPSKAEIAAWEKRKIEVDAAKQRMGQISTKLSGLPGGFVASTDMLGFYQKQLSTVAPNTGEWYQLQSKIDNINATIASEKVLARQGIKISYPGTAKPKATGASQTAGEPSAGGVKPSVKSSGGSKPSSGNVSLDSFINAIAKTESGGRYDARNKSTGAYGKYQILPSNWSSYAKRWLGDASAKPTPENQDKVAEKAFAHYYDKYDGDWAKMAAAWHAGVAGTAGGPGTGNWGAKTSKYVSTVLARAGTSYTPSHPVGTNAPRPSGTTTAATAGAHPSSSPPGGKGSGGGSKGAPVLKVITGVKYPVNPKRGDTDLRLQSEMTYNQSGPALQNLSLPKGLDAATFNKVYAAVESAFLAGEQAATVVLGPGNTMHLFIGDDPAEKIAFMRDMDDSRIGLRDAEAEAYKGTRSEATKANAALVARREKAGHELVILDMAGNGENNKVNPITAGIRSLDNVVAGVAMHTRLMDEAWARGDATAAYLQAQFIEDLTKPLFVNGRPVGDMAHLLDQVNQAQTRIAKLSGGAGMTPEQLLTGMGPAGTTIQKDMDRLLAAADEIAKAAEPGTESAAEMDNYLAKDASGKVIWIGVGGKQQVLEKPNVLKVVDKNGKVKRVLAEPGILPNGKPGYTPPDKTVMTFIRSGENIIDAYANYTVERVGTIRMPDGSEIPMMGKKVAIGSDLNNDGVNDSTSIYFENPMAPGQWSASPIIYKAPEGSTVRYASGSATPVVSFPVKGTKIVGTLVPDSKTGIYVVNSEEPPSQNGLGSSPGKPMAPIGTTADSPLARDMVRGFGRDLSGLSAEDQYMSRQQVPAIGFTAKEWAQTQLPGAAGSSRYGPPVPEHYKPTGSSVNKFTGFTVTQQQQQAANAKKKSDEAAAVVTYRQGEIASQQPPTTLYTGIPIPAKPGALGVNLNADLKAVDAAMGGTILPKPKVITPLPSSSSKAFKTPQGGMVVQAKATPKPTTTTTAKPKPKTEVNASTGFTVPVASKPAPKPLPKSTPRAL